MKCKKCGKSITVKYGYKVTRTGKVQRYQCQVCGHVFVKREAGTEGQ